MFYLFQVSWIRKRDLHILTSGSVTFTADSRFESVYGNDDFWGLRIRGVKISDTGQYECQVNTDPKKNFALNLTVSGKLVVFLALLFKQLIDCARRRRDERRR